MPTPRAARERHFVFYLALAALVVACLGNIITYALGKSTTDKIVAQRAIGRVLIARSDLDLCTTIYRNIYSATKAAEKKATFSYYHHLLPSLSDQEVANLVVENRTALQKQAAEFNPAQCAKLPSQKLSDPPTTTNGL